MWLRCALCSDLKAIKFRCNGKIYDNESNNGWMKWTVGSTTNIVFYNVQLADGQQI